MDAKPLIALCTCPTAELAQSVARRLVEARAAACVNILPGVSSVYAWQGKIQQDAELLLIAKTTEAAWPRLQACIQELHPYELPEIIAVPVVEGLPAYLHWMSQSTQIEDL